MNWLVQWSPCLYDISAWTLCSPFEVSENLTTVVAVILRISRCSVTKTCGGYPPSSTFSKHALYEISMPGLSAVSVLSCPQQIPDMCVKAPCCHLSVYTRSLFQKKIVFFTNTCMVLEHWFPRSNMLWTLALHSACKPGNMLWTTLWGLSKDWDVVVWSL